MSARKSERLLNLLIALLVSRGYLTKERLREVIPDYRAASSDEAFEKMFERDKEDLRALGIPVEVGGYDAFFDDEQGYRVRRDAFELPDISLEADEAAVVGLAARVWQQAGLASATTDALLKLQAAGVDVDREALDVAHPRVVDDEPSFETFWEAVASRRPVEFDYRPSGAAGATARRLEPWGVVSYRSRWYVVGHDRDRQAPRLFRLSRVVGPVRVTGPAGDFTVPEGTDIRALTGLLAPEHPEREATVLARPGRAVALRHRAREVDSGADVASTDGPGAGTASGSGTAPGSGTVSGWDRLTIPFGRTDSLVDELVSYGPDVVAEQPADLREAVVRRLQAVLDAGPDPEGGQ